MSATAAEAAVRVADWNAHHPPGTAVTYRSDQSWHATAGPAYLTSGGVAVVDVPGFDGPVPLDLLHPAEEARDA